MDITFDTKIVSPPVVHRYERGEWTLLYDPKNHSVVRANRQGLAVIESVARHPRLGDAIANIAETYGIPFDEVAGKAISFIFDLSNSGFLHIEKYRQRKVVDATPDAPKSIYIQNTERCNLSCVYCFNQEERAFFVKDHAEMTTEQMKWAVDQIADFGIPQINFCGGEPTLRDDLLEVASYARDRKRRVCLVTNGRQDSDEFLAAAAGLFDVIWVSIDSHREEIHEQHRGKKSFGPALNGLRKLAQIPNRHALILAASVISHKNWEDIVEMRRYFLEEVGVDRFRATTYCPGCAVSQEDEWPLQPPPFVRDASVLPPEEVELSDFSEGFDLKFEIEYNAEGEKRLKPPAKVVNHCGVGKGEMAMLSNGDIFPCQLLCKPEFLAGNIFHQSLREIYHESEVMKRFRALTVDRIQGCSTCDVRYVCGGSCRAAALDLHGTVNSHIDYECDFYHRCAVDQLWHDSKIPIQKVAEARKKFLAVKKEVEGGGFRAGANLGKNASVDESLKEEEQAAC